MPRPKKNGKYLNLNINQEIYERFAVYADAMGQTKTVALERILKKYLDEYEEKDSKTEYKNRETSINFGQKSSNRIRYQEIFQTDIEKYRLDST